MASLGNKKGVGCKKPTPNINFKNRVFTAYCSPFCRKINDSH